MIEALRNGNQPHVVRRDHQCLEKAAALFTRARDLGNQVGNALPKRLANLAICKLHPGVLGIDEGGRRQNHIIRASGIFNEDESRSRRMQELGMEDVAQMLHAPLDAALVCSDQDVRDDAHAPRVRRKLHRHRFGAIFLTHSLPHGRFGNVQGCREGIELRRYAERQRPVVFDVSDREVHDSRDLQPLGDLGKDIIHGPVVL
jgi:hypothetical protein